MASPTAEEQYLLELINEARLNPSASASRYISSYSPLTSSNADIQSALTFFNVSGSALQAAFNALTSVAPVAWNGALSDAAAAHNTAMIRAGEQSHQVAGEAALGARITAAGYTYRSVAENVYAYAESSLHAHAGFMVDWGTGTNGMQNPAGHRNTIMNATYTEVGISITGESTTANPLGPMVITQDFGTRSNTVFLLGVAYNDTDRNGFYSVGEGVEGLQITTATGSRVAGAASGGYSLQTAAGAQTFTLSGGGLAGSVVVKATIAGNLKLDVVNGNTLLSSGSITVESGAIAELRGLGTKGVSLGAGAGNQKFVGTIGNDLLNGGDGDDVFFGGKGDDTIGGGNGIDVAIFEGQSGDYFVSKTGGNNPTVYKYGMGIDLTIDVEILRFDDGDFYFNTDTEKLVRYTGPTASGENAAPVVAATQSVSTSVDTARTFTVLASDPDFDPLSYTAAGALHGSVSGGANGVFTYLPALTYKGTDSFTVTVSDGKGHSVVQTVNVTVAAANIAPVVAGTQSVATVKNTAKTVTVAATDADGDNLSYLASVAAHGTVTAGTGGVFTYTPTTGYTGSDSFTVTVSDGRGGTVSQTVNVTIAAGNVAPVVATSQSVSTAQNTAKPVTVTATDADGDALSFTAGIAAHGTVTGGTGGVFTYIPTTGYTGSDSFKVSVNDGNGHIVEQTVNVAIAAGSGVGSSTATFRVFANSGFAGEIGGNGTIIGSNGGEDIKLIASQPGNLSFDTSFNRGNDVVRLPGNASAYAISKVNSSAIITDGSHSYTVPFGDAGTDIAFADGVRTLRYDTASNRFLIGTQVVGATAASIVAPSEGAGLAIDQLTGATALVYLNNGADVAVGGKFAITGTSGSEDVIYKYGDVSLDGSFNRGGDTLVLPSSAANFSAYVFGSTVVVKSLLGSVTIPWGDVGMALNFNGDIRTLQYNADTNTVMIGNQAITGTTAASATTLSSTNTGGGTGGGSTGGETSADVGSAVSPFTLTLESAATVTLSDNARASNYVYVRNFNAGDTIKVTNATASDYNFTTIDANGDGKFNDLEIAFNDGSALNYMVLLDTISGSKPVYSEATAETAFGSNFITFG